MRQALIHNIISIFLLLALLWGSVIAQQMWYDHYTDAMEAVAKCQWEKAINELEHSLERKNNPELRAETYALRFVDYLPYFWLGVAHYNRGNVDKSLHYFQLSEEWNAIQPSPFHRSLLNYRSILEKIKATTDSIAALEAQLQELRERALLPAEIEQTLPALQSAIEMADYRTARHLLTTMRSLSRNAPLLAITDKLLQQLESITPGAPPADASGEVAELFTRALAFYLAQNYNDALSVFTEVAAQSPGYPQINDWIRKTRSEMQRIGLKPDTQRVTIVHYDTITTAPVVAFSLEAEVTRSDSMLISGFARDDQGVDYLEFTLNGRPYADQNGRPLRILPPSPEAAGSFSFSVRVPLELGENQIVFSAVDNDDSPHTASFPLTIYRQPPFYRTPAFIVSFAILLLLVFAGLLGNSLIKRRIAFVNKYNPYIAGAPIRNEKMFFGRKKLLQRLINTLHNNSIMIYGPRRIGKTSILHQLKNTLETQNDREYFYIPVYIDLQGTPEQKLFATMMEDMVEGCERYLNERPFLRIHQKTGEYTARDFSADIKQLLEQLRSLTAKRLKLVLLIDEVDELNDYSERVNQKLRSIFMKTFAEDLVAVMSGRYIRKQWDSEGSPWYNFFEEIEVPVIDRTAAEALIRIPVEGIFSYDDKAVKQIIDCSERVPYRIQKLCINVISRIIETRRRRVTVEDVEAVKARVLEGEDS